MRAALLHAAVVGSGGFIGAMLRYLLSTTVNRHYHSGFLPPGTVLVNLLGCLLIGVLAGIADHVETFNLEARLFLMVGLLGGFTTFSTFAYEGLQLLREGNAFAMLVYVGGQVMLGLLLVWSGYWLVAGR